jgi:hypothetical protein
MAGEVKDVKFSVIEDSEKLQAACALLNERYGWRGYGSSHVIPTGVHQTTFTAEVDDSVVGTITLAVDSDRGLNIDCTFGEEVDRIRKIKDAHICELTRFAFNGEVRSKEALAGLFNLAFIYGTAITQCTDLLIEVAPRHVSFYKAMLGFRRLGSLRPNENVGSPAQLMGLRVEEITRKIADLAGRAEPASSRSLYPYFYAPADELKIRRSLTLNRKMSQIYRDVINARRIKPCRVPGDQSGREKALGHITALALSRSKIGAASMDIGDRRAA